MDRTELDIANSEVGKLIYRLRQAIDVFRVIGLNVEALDKRNAGTAFFGYVQSTALEQIALIICKIYEREKGYELNSIRGVIRRLSERSFTREQLRGIELFGRKYGNVGVCVDAEQFLCRTVELFGEGHKEALRRLNTFRDKFAAHSEAGIQLQPLPSQDDFECRLQFAYDFYSVIHDSVVGVGPALMSSHSGWSLIRLMEAIGIKDPVFHFPE
jgi:hypothetical protein